MSTEIAVTQATLPEQMEFARVLAKSRLLPKEYQEKPENVLYAIQYATALGIEPIHALTSIHVISGKPSASADLIAGLVRRAGHKLRVTSTDDQATAVLIRADDPDFEYTATWTIDKAKRAGLLSNPSWGKYPAAMLRSRAITEVSRQGASDALFGVSYAPEELGAVVNAQGAPVHGGHIVKDPPARVTAAEILAEPMDADIVDDDALADFMEPTP